MTTPAALEAAARIADLGFLDVHGDRPWEPGGARLIVGLRSTPALTHFDPEWVGYWHVHDGRGRIARLDRETPLPVDRPFSWGRIKIVDRLGVSNSFLGFGGTLMAEPIDEVLTVAIFASPGPLARWTGHSQAPDPLAERIGAFFARLMVPIDFSPEFEPRLSGSDPLAIYAAMVADWHEELAASATLRDLDPGAAAMAGAELRRIRQADPAAWSDGQGLLEALSVSG